MNRIAVQSFGLKKEFASDLTGTIRKIHEIGFDGIEPLILFQAERGKMPKNVWAQDAQEIAFAAMKDLGMSIPSAHIGVGFGIFTMPVNRIIQSVLDAHEKYGIETFVMTAPFGTAVSALRWAKLVKAVSEAVKPHGCRILSNPVRQVPNHFCFKTLLWVLAQGPPLRRDREICKVSWALPRVVGAS